MKIIADNALAKAVNRSDLCIVKQRKLFLQTLVSRMLHQCFLQRLSHTLAHLPGGCIRKCHHQKPVNINRMFGIGHLLYDPLHQNCRLAGACCRRYENIAVSCVNNTLLILCPLHTSHIPVPLLFCLCLVSILLF